MQSEGVHHRRSVRLRDRDYGQPGAYFVTIVAHGRECIFGAIAGGEMQCNQAGEMVKAVWTALPQRFPTVEMGAFALMPNHFHGIVAIHEHVGATLVVAPSARAGTSPAPTNGIGIGRAQPTLGEIVGAFKSITTHEYIKAVAGSGWRRFDRHLWQRNYYEHIIRNTDEWSRMHLYIEGNPAQWDKDEDNPENVP